MPSLQRAGVFVQETNFTSFTNAPPGNSVAAFVGQHNRGPIDQAVFVTSWSNFVNQFGGFNGVNSPTNLQLGVYTFFQNGGTSCYCVRATGSATATSSLVLYDSTNSASTIALTADNPGVWGNNIAVGVSAGLPVPLPSVNLTTTAISSQQLLSAAPSTFVTSSVTAVSLAQQGFGASSTFQVVDVANTNWTVTYAGLSNYSFLNCTITGNASIAASQYVTQTIIPTIPSFNLTVYYGGTTNAFVVERWSNLTMVAGNSQYYFTALNSSVSGSNWVVASTSPTGNIPKTFTAGTPTAGAPTGGLFTGGNDGVAIGAGGYTTSSGGASTASGFLNALDAISGPLILNLPGVTNGTDLSNAVGYAAGRQDIFTVLDPPQGQSVTQVTTTVVNAINPSNVGLSVDPFSFGAMYYPWISIADPSTSSPGATRLVPPGGLVVGQYTRTDSLRGVFKAPAGLQTQLSGAVGVEIMLANADLDTLNSGITSGGISPPVNAIRQVPGSGIVIWGARTLSGQLQNRYVPVRRTLIYLRCELLARTNFAVFEPDDWTLWNNLASVLSNFLGQFWQTGGLAGQSVAEAFFVTVDDTNNTPTTIANGEVHIDVGVAVERPAEFIIIRLGQWDGGSQATIIG
jgi:hypothetical protein